MLFSNKATIVCWKICSRANGCGQQIVHAPLLPGFYPLETVPQIRFDYITHPPSFPSSKMWHTSQERRSHRFPAGRCHRLIKSTTIRPSLSCILLLIIIIVIVIAIIVNPCSRTSFWGSLVDKSNTNTYSTALPAATKGEPLLTSRFTGQIICHRILRTCHQVFCLASYLRADVVWFLPALGLPKQCAFRRWIW